MAVVSRVATLRLDDTATHTTTFLQWVATADVQDTAAGGSVNVTVVRTVQGATPPGDPNTLTLNFYNSSGGLIRAVTLNTTAASQSTTFHFTDNGESGGTARCGTVEIAIRATRTDATTYDVETDASPNTPPTGFDSHLDRGWIRGTTTLVEAASNVSAGGAKTEPAEFDESLFVRTTSGHVSYVARALTVASSVGSLSGSTNSTTAVTRDVTFANVVDDRFAAASTAVGWTVTVPNPTTIVTGSPDWTYTSTTDDTITVDPRVTNTLHFQVDDSTYSAGAHEATKQMLSTQSGFLWSKITAARGTVKSGVTVSQTLDPVNPGTTVGPTSFITDANGVAGPLEWTSSKPGGTWNWTVDITAPTDIDADTHLLTPTDSVTMLNTDPRIQVMVRVGPSTAGTEDRHLIPGDEIKIAVCPFNRVTRKKITPDAAPLVALVRYDLTNGWEYLSSGGTWTDWGSGATDAFTTITDPADADCWSYTFSSTSGWGTTDLVAVQVSFNFEGTPYGFYVPRELTGESNPHDGNDFDAVGFATRGAISFQ